MNFQIVEISLDANDQPTGRKVVAPSFHDRAEAVALVESVISNYDISGHSSEHDYWWATAANGDLMRFVIEAI